MKKNKRILYIVSILVLILLVSVGIILYQNREIEVPLDNFKLNDEYVYDGIPWGTSLKEVKRKLPFSIEKFDLSEVTTDKGTMLVDYRAEKGIILDGYVSYATTFKFEDDEFIMAMFNFRIEENAKEYYDTQLEKLVELYGQESHISENDKGHIVYRWDTEMTTLQLAYSPSKDNKAIVTLGVGYRYNSVQK